MTIPQEDEPISSRAPGTDERYLWLWLAGPAFVFAGNVVGMLLASGPGRIASDVLFAAMALLLIIGCLAHAAGLGPFLATLAPGRHWSNPLHWLLLTYHAGIAGYLAGLAWSNELRDASLLLALAAAAALPLTASIRRALRLLRHNEHEEASQ